MLKVIRGSWVLGYRHGRHWLMKDAVVLIENDLIRNVLSSYEGPADEEYDGSDQVIIPGLIDTHVHVGTRATHRLLCDSGTDAFYGQPFLHWAVTRPGASSPGGDGVPVGGRSDELACEFTVAELLRNGVTTFLEVGARPSLLRVMASVAERMGIRAMLGPGVTSASYQGSADGKMWSRVWDEEREQSLLAEAVRFIERYEGVGSGRIRATVVAREAENCSPQLLRRLVDLARESDLPLVTHAAYSPIEWQCISQEHGITPIEYLAANGVLGERTIIEHGNLVAESNPFWSGGKDLRLLGDSGTSVSHSPINLVRRGRRLDSISSYEAAGINLSLGADTYPRDPFMQMRSAADMCKSVTGDYRSASTEVVFNMATLGGAHALGRTDLGRLEAGAKADVVAVALRPRDSLRMGVIRDPISALVDCAVGDDVRMVMVDGVTRVANGRVLGVSTDDLLEAAQQAAVDYWAAVPEWHPFGETADRISPIAFSTDRAGGLSR